MWEYRETTRTYVRAGDGALVRPDGAGRWRATLSRRPEAGAGWADDLGHHASAEAAMAEVDRVAPLAGDIELTAEEAARFEAAIAQADAEIPATVTIGDVVRAPDGRLGILVADDVVAVPVEGCDLVDLLERDGQPLVRVGIAECFESSTYDGWVLGEHHIYADGFGGWDAMRGAGRTASALVDVPRMESVPDGQAAPEADTSRLAFRPFRSGHEWTPAAPVRCRHCDVIRR